MCVQRRGGRGSAFSLRRGRGGGDRGDLSGGVGLQLTYTQQEGRVASLVTVLSARCKSRQVVLYCAALSLYCVLQHADQTCWLFPPQKCFKWEIFDKVHQKSQEKLAAPFAFDLRFQVAKR